MRPVFGRNLPGTRQAGCPLACLLFVESNGYFCICPFIKTNYSYNLPKYLFEMACYGILNCINRESKRNLLRKQGGAEDGIIRTEYREIMNS